MAKNPAAKPRTRKKAAAKSTAPEQSVPDGGPRASEEYVPLIKPSVLKALLKKDGSFRDDISELTGQLREEIGNAVNNHNLDKDAFALLKRFAKMKPEKRAILWREFVAYMKICGFLADIDSRPELPLDAGADFEQSGSRPPQFGGVKEIAEKAGARVEE